MSEHDPRCVFVADSVEEGQIMVAHLGAENVEARLMNDSAAGGFEVHHVLLPGRTAEHELEVWVVDPADADRARQIVMEKVSAFVQVKRARSEQSDPATAVCEDCGQSAEYPPEQSGTIQNCPHCGAYVDVPDGGVEAESEFDSAADDESEVDPS